LGTTQTPRRDGGFQSSIGVFDCPEKSHIEREEEGREKQTILKPGVVLWLEKMEK